MQIKVNEHSARTYALEKTVKAVVESKLGELEKEISWTSVQTSDGRWTAIIFLTEKHARLAYPLASFGLTVCN